MPDRVAKTGETQSKWAGLADLIFGKPLRTSQERAEQIGPAAGIPIFGLDALSSAGYGPEAALTILLPISALAAVYILPITGFIVVLLAIVYFSYMQTIPAYPGGGGSYTVARENLGESASLLAASALMIDYILTVAVGISAGVGALVSAFPSLQPHTLGLCLGILVFIALINLRGLREAGVLFIAPTFVFIGSLVFMIVVGVARAVLHGGHPAPVAPLPHPALPATTAVTGWLLLQSFASGCTAMTGVEAVSNGVRAFREPAVKNARITLTIIIAILVVLLLGIAFLSRIYSVTATPPGEAGYESVISQLLGAVVGKGVFYYVAIGSILAVLALSANTAFADFPRLCQAIARNGYLPKSFALRGRRLVFSQGIYALTFVAGALLVVFGGITDRLIPLYAIGAFLAFTLSQAGMVAHWRRAKGRHVLSMFLNGMGAFTTAITVCVVLVAKFVEGAWITLALIPVLFVLMKLVHYQYQRMESAIALNAPLDLSKLTEPIVIIPISDWNRITQKAIRFALEISSHVHAIHVHMEETPSKLAARWKELVEEPAARNGFPAPPLKIIPSPYRYVLNPILEYVTAESKKHPDRHIAVIIPEKILDRWYHYFLHNRRGTLLKALLYFQGNPQIVVMNVPWYVKTPHH